MSLYMNLDKDNKVISNNNLINKVKNNEINLDNIAFLKPHELFPEKWEKIIRTNKKARKVR